MKKLRASCLLAITLLSCTITAITPPARALAHAHQWREVQQKAINTVVQIFSFKFERDIIEPYMMPYQQACRGSGFLIQYDEKIYIVTNAHVVNQAESIHISIPCFGQQMIKCELVGICHDRDIALLKFAAEEEEKVRYGFGGSIPYLTLGSSDNLCRADQVLAIGYPLGETSVKTTCGVYCGHQTIDLMPGKLLQIDAPINPGSSGGPLLNIDGEVVGINAGGVMGAQNAGYSIPSKWLILSLSQLTRQRLVKKPSLGIVSSHASHMAEYLGNPLPGGAYLSEVIAGSPLDKAGIKKGDMMYQINGYNIDTYGDITVPWTEDRLSIVDYISSIPVEDDIHVVVYRNGERIERTVRFGADFQMGIKRIYPGYEDIDYEVFGGMVVMELSHNHIEAMGDRGAPGLKEYSMLKNQHKPVLVVTHVFPTSELFLTRTIGAGAILNQVNDIEVHTLEDYRNAIKVTAQRDFLTLRATDTVSALTDNICVALRTKEVIKQEPVLSMQYRYTISPIVRSIMNEVNGN